MTIHRNALLVALLAATMASPPALHAAAGETAMTPGTPWTGAVGIPRSVGQIMSSAARSAGQPVGPDMSEREHEWPDRALDRKSVV